MLFFFHGAPLFCGVMCDCDGIVLRDAFTYLFPFLFFCVCVLPGDKSLSQILDFFPLYLYVFPPINGLPNHSQFTILIYIYIYGFLSLSWGIEEVDSLGRRACQSPIRFPLLIPTIWANSFCITYFRNYFTIGLYLYIHICSIDCLSYFNII